MTNYELNEEECIRLLTTARMGRLACANQNQPYIVPVYLAYEKAIGSNGYFYGFSVAGQKIDWMRENPKVCVETDDITSYDLWTSFIATGSYEELSSSSKEKNNLNGRPPERSTLQTEAASGNEPSNAEVLASDQKLEHALQIIKANPMWQEPACSLWIAHDHEKPGEPITPVFFRIRIETLSGRQARRDSINELSSTAAQPVATKAKGRSEPVTNDVLESTLHP